jgi:hypothetical protein
LSQTSRTKLPSHIPFPLNELANWVQDIDVLWFRWLAVATSLVGIGYKILYPHETPLWMVVCWNILFILINLIHITILLQGRKPVRFDAEEQELYDTLFYRFSPVEFSRLLHIGHWCRGEAGETLTREGEPVTHLILIYDGVVEVESKGQLVTQLHKGSFIGEMSLITNNPASATVRINEPVRYLRWEKSELQRLLQRDPSLNNAMQTVVATDLTRKLTTDKAL